MREIVIDTETTGLDPAVDRIVEIGAVEVIDREITGRYLHHYVNPGRPVAADATAIHGITDAFLADKPVWRDVNDGVMEFLDGAVLVAHNAVFDRSFLPETGCEWIDTYKITKTSLDQLCKRFGIRADRSLHGALLDAQLLAQCYIRLPRQQAVFDLRRAVQAVSYESRQRPRPLAPRLTDADIARHRSYVAKFAVWKDYI